MKYFVDFMEKAGKTDLNGRQAGLLLVSFLALQLVETMNSHWLETPTLHRINVFVKTIKNSYVLVIWLAAKLIVLNKYHILNMDLKQTL
jgi:hypothetical protein